ncbi:MAG: DUF4382 domain-containing protein [Woeseiaceae bacterium]
MNTRNVLTSARIVAAALFVSLFVVACGSSGGSGTDARDQPTTGTVGLLLTDAATDLYSEINFVVREAVLIGGDESQEILFDGSEPIDLLDLENFSEPVIFGEVQAGNYVKLRLMLDDLELVPYEGEPIHPPMPANGKVDLLAPEGFDVLPGRTLLITVDVDADKSLKIHTAGNSGRVQFRPVVKAEFSTGDIDPRFDKLVRLEGAASGDPDLTDGTFVLCDIDSPDYCVDVATDSMTSIFDDEGVGTDLGTLMDGDMAVVIGEYGTDPIVLNAILLEICGYATLVVGEVVSEPAGGVFLLLDGDGDDFVVELQPGFESQPGTLYYDEDGPIDSSAIMLGDEVEVEGVLPAVEEGEPDLLRAALVFLEAEDDDQLSGTIAEPIDDVTMTFVLATYTGDVNVCVLNDAFILLVDETNAEVTMATFADLEAGQVVDVFGMPAADDSCFEANEILVEVPPAE